jgi:S1-C subfamily serine protease
MLTRTRTRLAEYPISRLAAQAYHRHMNATTALAELSNDLAAAIARVAPSVVYVDADRRRDASGFAWTPNLIVTSDHTVDRDDDIELFLAGGTRVAATLVGRDPSTDLALLRSATPLPAAPRADSSALAAGHLVLAVSRDEDGEVGASFGVASVVGEGWRTRRGGEIDRFVRPDCNVYPGFSGGPLVDVEGAVLGLNTWGLSRRYAVTVPLATIERVVAQLESGGRIKRGYLGLAMQPVRLPGSLRERLGLPQEGGAIVIDAATGGPADRAGVAIGDVIVGIGAHAVEDAEDVQHALGSDTVGTPVLLHLLRGGERREISVVVGERGQSDD